MILALDSSSGTASVCLLDGLSIVKERAEEAPRTRGGALFRCLESVLAGNPEISRVVVGNGPGSYNGLRSTLAAGWGLAKARNVPLVAVSSVLGLADGRYCAIGDARRGQYYFAIVADGAFEQEPKLVEAQKLAALLPLELPVYAPGPVDIAPQAIVGRPSAARLARIGACSPVRNGLPEPIYLKPAYINLPEANQPPPA